MTGLEEKKSGYYYVSQAQSNKNSSESSPLLTHDKACLYANTVA